MSEHCDDSSTLSPLSQQHTEASFVSCSTPPKRAAHRQGPAQQAAFRRSPAERASGPQRLDKGRGVCKKKNKWEAQVMVNQEWIYRELFDTEHQAQEGYNSAVSRLRAQGAVPIPPSNSGGALGGFVDQGQRWDLAGAGNQLFGVHTAAMAEHGDGQPSYGRLKQSSSMHNLPGSILPGIQQTMTHGGAHRCESQADGTLLTGSTYEAHPTAQPRVSSNQGLVMDGQGRMRKSDSVSTLLAHATLSEGSSAGGVEPSPLHRSWFHRPSDDGLHSGFNQGGHNHTSLEDPSLNAASLLLGGSRGGAGAGPRSEGFGTRPYGGDDGGAFDGASQLHGNLRNAGQGDAALYSRGTAWQPSSESLAANPNMYLVAQQMPQQQAGMTRIMSAPSLNHMRQSQAHAGHDGAVPETVRQSRLLTAELMQRSQAEGPMAAANARSAAQETAAKPATRGGRRASARQQTAKAEPAPAPALAAAAAAAAAPGAAASDPDVHAHQLRVQQALLLQQQRLHEQMQQHQQQHMEQQQRAAQRQEELLRRQANPHSAALLPMLGSAAPTSAPLHSSQLSGVLGAAALRPHAGVAARSPKAPAKKGSGRQARGGGAVRKQGGRGRGAREGSGAGGKIPRTPSLPSLPNFSSVKRSPSMLEMQQQSQMQQMRKVQSLVDFSSMQQSQSFSSMDLTPHAPTLSDITPPRIASPQYSSGARHEPLLEHIKEEEPHRAQQPPPTPPHLSNFLGNGSCNYDDLFQIMDDTSNSWHRGLSPGPQQGQAPGGGGGGGAAASGFERVGSDSLSANPRMEGLPTGMDDQQLIDELFADDPLLELTDKTDFAEMSEFVDLLISPSHSHM